MNVLRVSIMIGVYLNGVSEPSYQTNPVEVGRVEEVVGGQGHPGRRRGDALPATTRRPGPTTRRRCCSRPAARSRSLVRREQQTLHFTPDLIEKYHAADLGIRPMLHMRVGRVTPASR